MISEQNINEWAERYLQNALNEQELGELEEALQSDSLFQAHWNRTVELLSVFKSGTERTNIKNLIQSVADNPAEWQTEAETPSPAKAKVIPFGKYLRVTSAAASLILASSFFTYMLTNKDSGKVNQKQLVNLRRDIDHIKISQNKIIDSLNKQKAGEAAQEQIEEAALFGGTGFAISNNGYVATNYHVVKDANAIYIQTPKGDMKAFIVAREPNADIAILKIEDKNFRFTKSSLPYNISKSVSALGQQVFSIGFPTDNVVYNEGYISCEKGFGGDTNSYQLEMTANPGQSGSPVFDKGGNIIAVVTGKQSNTAGTTFAVHTEALVDLVQSLPKSQHINLPASNKVSRLDRTEQVKRMKDFVFSVKVN